MRQLIVFVVALSSRRPAGRSSPRISFSSSTPGVSGRAVGIHGISANVPGRRRSNNPSSQMGRRHDSANSLLVALLCP